MAPLVQVGVILHQVWTGVLGSLRTVERMEQVSASASVHHRDPALGLDEHLVGELARSQRRHRCVAVSDPVVVDRCEPQGRLLPAALETVAGRTLGERLSVNRLSRPALAATGAMEPSGSCHQSIPVDATDDRNTHRRLCPHGVHLDRGAKQGRLRAAPSPDERACAARGEASPHLARSYQPAHRDHHQGSAELVARVEPPARWDARGHTRSWLDAIPDAPRM